MRRLHRKTSYPRFDKSSVMSDPRLLQVSVRTYKIYSDNQLRFTLRSTISPRKSSRPEWHRDLRKWRRRSVLRLRIARSPRRALGRRAVNLHRRQASGPLGIYRRRREWALGSCADGRRGIDSRVGKRIAVRRRTAELVRVLHWRTHAWRALLSRGRGLRIAWIWRASGQVGGCELWTTLSRATQGRCRRRKTGELRDGWT